MRKLLLACLVYFSSFTPVSAVSVSVVSAPGSIGEDKFSVTVRTDGASAGTNYLRVDLYLDGSKNYFGETDNGQSWYNGSDGKQYFPITIIAGESNIATVSARVGEPSRTDYPGPGLYKLRIRRYTSSGGQGSEDPSPVDISISKLWPSPSPSPSPSPVPTLTPSPSPSSQPTADPPRADTPTPTPKPSPKLPSPSLSPTPTGTVAGEASEIDLSGFGVLASPKSQDAGGSPTKPVINKSRAKSAIIIGFGLILISLSSFLGYRKYLTRPKPEA